MRLTELVDTYKGKLDPEIRGLTQDSRRVEPGWLFAALPGSKVDGRSYIADALHLGAAAVLAPPGTKIEARDIAVISSDNPRRLLAQMAAKFYSKQPQTIAAVTGTNGKTSTVYFTQQIWQALGHKAASIGTLGVRGPGMVRSGSLTTPDPVSLHAELADLASSGITHLAMEASSHGLHQNRLDGVRVSAAGFTNLTHDHLDYHDTMEDYLQAKMHLFEHILVDGGTAVLNADIPEYADLAGRVKGRGCRVISYGRKGKDVELKNTAPQPQGQRIEIKVEGVSHTLNIPLVGAFQVMNALCALGLVMAGNVKAVDIIPHLEKLTGAPGRLQLVPGNGDGAVYVDYAHTPDALENILKALRPHTEGRLICIAGCGGDRDARKRPVMGRIAAELADFAVITDDNPRSEDPALIRAAMMAGAGSKAKEIPGRREAIIWSVAQMKKGDVLVIAGKGHEQGQIIGSRVEPFDDVEEARKAMDLSTKQGLKKGTST